MSTTSTPNDSPIQPLHNPAHAAQVVVPQAPLGNVVNNPGMGAKALLAKKLAKSHNPAFISPTDNLMTPVTQKLTAAKKMQFSKASKPLPLFTKPTADDKDPDADPSDKESDDDKPAPSNSLKMEVDDENPF